jgi:hypothetical protein
MADTGDVAVLSARIAELEAQLLRAPSLGSLRASTNCTDCGSNCTNCRGDRLFDVLLPGERAGLSGRELVNRLGAGGK